MLAAFAGFAATSAVIVLFPGPDTLVVLRSLLRGGRRAAARTAAGVLSGLAIWVAGAALGLSALLRASHDGYLALRVVGGIYLVVLGAKSLMARADVPSWDADPLDHPSNVSDTVADRPRSGLLGTGYRAGLVTDLLNPKVGVFFVTFLPGFVPRGAPVGAVSLALGGVFIFETACYFAAMILASDRVARLMTSPRLRRRIDRLTGIVLIGFGLRLALEG